MNRIILFVLLFTMTIFSRAQNIKNGTNSLNIIIDKNVLNAEDQNEKEIIKIWNSYLNSGEYKNPKTIYWDRSEYPIPDYFLWPVNIKNLKSRTPKVQCTIIGIYPTENNHYALKTSLTRSGANGEIVLKAIISVFAKKINGDYLLVSSSQYHKGLWKKNM
ncbi:hypothetical protein [Psychroflexus sp. MES1-P1E]|uniref:hypothetical protein n=1 Tax=Psychroflexus sp. MES1-P1E TaxID=2058320 RepID=UPI0011AE6D77|nr:hypothetical protein [Psychroflexus sp. MES1-P1E]